MPLADLTRQLGDNGLRSRYVCYLPVNLCIKSETVTFTEFKNKRQRSTGFLRPTTSEIQGGKEGVLLPSEADPTLGQRKRSTDGHGPTFHNPPQSWARFF